MKLNKWTVGLASVGMVSVASFAEEKANMVQTMLDSTMLSGYVDTSAQWNLGTSDVRLPDYKFGGSGKADGFNLDVVQIRIEKPIDSAEWAAGYRIDLWAGPDANALATQSFGPTVENGIAADFAIRQAYLTLRVPIGNGLDWKLGVFDSIIGYESVEGPANPNYTRSFGHTIEPQTLTGILASYRFCESFAASAGVANTKGPGINSRAFGEDGKAESSKTWMASFLITVPESCGFLAGSTLEAGVVNGLDENESRSDYDENSTSYYVGATIATPVSGLRFGGAFDYLDVHNQGGETYAIAGYASFQATEKLSLHFRGEYLRDRGQQKFFTLDSTDPAASTNPDRAMALTATAQYDLWKNVISRVEFRWDHSLSGQQVWGNPGTSVDGGSLHNEWLLAANLIYKF
jgi:Putative beta-barrel porin-2, OmpL-like. bbp2